MKRLRCATRGMRVALESVLSATCGMSLLVDTNKVGTSLRKAKEEIGG